MCQNFIKICNNLCHYTTFSGARHVEVTGIIGGLALQRSNLKHIWNPSLPLYLIDLSGEVLYKSIQKCIISNGRAAGYADTLTFINGRNSYFRICSTPLHREILCFWFWPCSISKLFPASEDSCADGCLDLTMKLTQSVMWVVNRKIQLTKYELSG